MNNNDKSRVCPVELAGSLDSKFRKIFQNPKKILKPFIKEGMTVFELGSGPGFFTKSISELAGPTGKVIAADLQEGMLEIVKAKTEHSELKDRIQTHLCKSDTIDFFERVDFVFAFYVVHEIPDKERLFAELKLILKPGGRMLIIEPPFHVPKHDFRKMLDILVGKGFRVIDSPKFFPNRVVYLELTE
ncbi:MAG: methyltransferase domain-containing protein [Ignavibacteria bacterium]|nr:methyltransferase domain-containing protein [Ignavibacteria bacterium]